MMLFARLAIFLQIIGIAFNVVTVFICLFCLVFFSLVIWLGVVFFFLSLLFINFFMAREREKKKKTRNRVRKYNRWSYRRVIWWDDFITFLASCLTATLFFINFQSLKLLLDLFLVDFYYILNFIIYFN